MINIDPIGTVMCIEVLATVLEEASAATHGGCRPKASINV